MTTTAITLKKSSVAGKIPGDSDLSYGELAINYYDGTLYYKNSSNEIKLFGDSDRNAALLNTSISSVLPLSGGTMSGELLMGGFKITNLGAAVDQNDAVTKGYVDIAIADGVSNVNFPEGDYGTTDSAGTDPFGIAIGAVYESLGPIGSIINIELGSDSSV